MKTGSAVGADVHPASNRDAFQAVLANIVRTPSAMSMATTCDEFRPFGLDGGCRLRCRVDREFFDRNREFSLQYHNYCWILANFKPLQCAQYCPSTPAFEISGSRSSCTLAPDGSSQVDFMQGLTYPLANMPGWCIAGLKASA
jgi:hypothetical protein